MRGRRIGIGALLVLGTLFWTFFGIGLWAQRQALDTDEWVDTSTELLENEEIRTALGVYLVDQLYQSADVQDRIEEALPPALDRLAAPAAAGLKEVASRNAPRLLGSAVAIKAWREANREAHDELLAVIDGGDGDVALKLDALLSQIAGASGLPADIVDRLPPQLATLQVASADELDTVRKAVDLFEALAWVLLVLALLCFAGALALSRDRRRTAVTVGGCLIFAAVLILAIRRLTGTWLVDSLAEAPNAQGAVDDVWDIATSLLVDTAWGSILFGFFIITAGWLAGAGRRATDARRLAAPVLREHTSLVRAGIGVAILLLVIWGPVPWTQKIVPVLIFIVAVYVWFEWIRARTLEEFSPPAAGAAPAPADAGSPRSEPRS